MKTLLLIFAAAAFSVVAFAQNRLERDINSGIRYADGTIVVGPDPSNLSELFQLLEDPQVRVELSLHEQAMKAIDQIGKTHSGQIAELQKENAPVEVQLELRNAQKEIYEASISELLRPDQFERLKNIVYRMEVARIGFARALTSGLLARDVGVYEDQREEVFRSAHDIETELEEEIRIMKARAEKAILRNLTPEQRERAESLLGEPFDYKVLSAQQKIQEQLEGSRSPPASRAQGYGNALEQKSEF